MRWYLSYAWNIIERYTEKIISNQQSSTIILGNIVNFTIYWNPKEVKIYKSIMDKKSNK